MGTEKGTTYLLSSFFFSIFLTIVCQRTVKAQSLPPAKYDGFLYTNHRVDSDTIMIEAFFDPVCPDSRDAWPPLKQAIHHYGSRVSLIVHLLPLPYHDYAFSTSRALHIVNLLNPSATFRLLESFFEYQGRFYNAETSNKSRDAVVDEIIKLAAETVGNSYYSAIELGFNDRKTDLKTRISFKYSASRGCLEHQLSTSMDLRCLIPAPQLIISNGEASLIHCFWHRAERETICRTYLYEDFRFSMQVLFA